LKHTDAISSDKDAQKDQIKASEAQVDAQVAQLAAAEAGAESAKAQLAKAVIAAPFAGVISRQDIKVGETAQNNIPVITLISRDSFKIEIFASQIEVQDLKIGDAAQVTLDDNSGSYVAKITAIDPAESVLNNVSNYKVTLNFIDPVSGLRSGVGANALVTGKTKNNIVAVPQSAVFKADGKNFVFVLQNGLQEQKEVQLGIVGTDGQVEVTGGLSAGDSILILKN
jgi:membrane fusion protein (multidrug efflux system)